MVTAAESRLSDFQSKFRTVQAEVKKFIVGNDDIIEAILTSLLVNGHVLLEGIPGLGKTSLVHTIAECLHLEFSRIQFTPDLMPGDILGTHVFQESPDGAKTLEFEPGPLFANLVLADEINRATPKTQSALLEAMQEQTITVGRDTHKLAPPFFVLATQNPLEMEGTYPLPEAQLDRFLFKLKMIYPGVDELHEILDRTTAAETPQVQPVLGGDAILEMRKVVRSVPVARPVQNYAIRLVLATHPDSEYSTEKTRRYVRFGASPRGVQALILAGKVKALLAGRAHVSGEDIRTNVLAALRHRVLLNFEGEADRVDLDEILQEAVEQTSPPA
jgi:MoxR-like ATPase